MTITHASNTRQSEDSLLRSRRTARTFGFRSILSICVLSLAFLSATRQINGFQASKNWKDRQEYDLAREITFIHVAPMLVEKLNAWADKYPQSDWVLNREFLLGIAISKLLPEEHSSSDKIQMVREQLHFGKDPVVLRDRAPTNLDQLQTAASNLVKFADAAFAPKWKPAGVTADDWGKAKQIELGLGHKALAWCFIQRKDTDAAKKEAALSLQADPDQPDIEAFLQK